MSETVDQELLSLTCAVKLSPYGVYFSQTSPSMPLAVPGVAVEKVMFLTTADPVAAVVTTPFVCDTLPLI
jgi:hypothetical protein